MQTHVADLANTFVRAAQLHQQGQHAEAARLCQAILRAKPDHVQGLHLFGPCLMHFGDVAATDRAFASLLASSPGDPATLPNRGVRDYGDGPIDVAEKAAPANLMDVVVSFDTAIAHLAGALALPVWLLISNPPEWRWRLERGDSPWYPTARLFRQRARSDWLEVVARVTQALRARNAESGRPAETTARNSAASQ